MTKKIGNAKNEKLSVNVLLAEDDPLSQEIIAEMLESIGCKVDVVTNGKELLDSMNRASYNLVLMNCQMPVINGLQATAEIRHREKSTGKRIPIIALTANAMSGYKQKCLDAGMDDYLSKPFNQEQLSEKLFRWF